jgi:hypothetical protein
MTMLYTIPLSEVFNNIREPILPRDERGKGPRHSSFFILFALDLEAAEAKMRANWNSGAPKTKASIHEKRNRFEDKRDYFEGAIGRFVEADIAAGVGGGRSGDAGDRERQYRVQ